jgi:hypothetical protein
VARREWVISPRWLGLIFLGIMVYVAIAEWLEFYPGGGRLPDEGFLRARVLELPVLWALACLVLGWTKYLRGWRAPRRASVWPIVVIPVLLILPATSVLAWEAWAEYASNWRRGNPGAGGWLTLRWTMVVVPLVYSCMVGFVLFVQTWVWRHSVTAGRCPSCDYDLTGNTSGTCPECGGPAVSDPSIPRAFYAKRYRWLPELGAFRDARARYDAWKHVRAERRYSWPNVVGVSAALSLAVCLLLEVVPGRSTPWLAVEVVMVVWAAAGLAERREFRRALRGRMKNGE